MDTVVRAVIAFLHSIAALIAPINPPQLLPPSIVVVVIIVIVVVVIVVIVVVIVVIVVVLIVVVLVLVVLVLVVLVVLVLVVVVYVKKAFLAHDIIFRSTTRLFVRGECYAHNVNVLRAGQGRRVIVVGAAIARLLVVDHDEHVFRRQPLRYLFLLTRTAFRCWGGNIGSLVLVVAREVDRWQLPP
jgi:hypothetical protein